MIQPLTPGSPSRPTAEAASPPGLAPQTLTLPQPVLDDFARLAKGVGGLLGVKHSTSIPDVIRAVLGKIYPRTTRDAAGDLLLTETADFRDTLAHGRELAAKLASMDPSNPDYAKVEAELRTSEAALTAGYGYTLDSAPKASALWVDPQFLSAELPGGQVNAKNFPTGTPVLTPPDPMKVLFPDPRPYRFADLTGLKDIAGNPAEYRSCVAKHRAEAHMPISDGEPIGVQVDFQGGGGKGKRYLPALQEMLSLGVVPTSVSGSSAGAIAAGLTAAGATPEQLAAFVLSPAISKFLDVDLHSVEGGLADGQVAFDLFDQSLREITGIRDRPVTFADLKTPLRLLATKYSDSDPAPGTEDLTKPENRTFVFSQETTPDTPVALAIRASMAIPFVFDPVQMMDPVTGRRVTLVDGGAVNNFAVGYGHNTLPEIGLALLARNDDNPATHPLPDRTLPDGQLDASHVLWNGANGWDIYADGNVMAHDFYKRAAPAPNQFMIGLPVWNLADPRKQDSSLKFAYDPKSDPAIDVQTTATVRHFLQQHLAQMRTPGASATNVVSEAPRNLSFDVKGLKLHGRDFTAHYAGGDVVRFQSGGLELRAHLGVKRITAMYLDGVVFHDLAAQLQRALEVHVQTLGVGDHI